MEVEERCTILLLMAYSAVVDGTLFLGAACGSPYIVFILRPSYGFMLRIYVYTV